MPPLVSSEAMISCSMASPPTTPPLNVTPVGTPVTCTTLAATIDNFVPVDNIPSFGMCMAPDNPAVAAATSAAMGVLTPAPCVPATSSPWTPGATRVTVHGQPALHSQCTCMCDWGGIISIESPGNDGTVSVT